MVIYNLQPIASFLSCCTSQLRGGRAGRFTGLGDWGCGLSAIRVNLGRFTKIDPDWSGLAFGRPERTPQFMARAMLTGGSGPQALPNQRDVVSKQFFENNYESFYKFGVLFWGPYIFHVIFWFHIRWLRYLETTSQHHGNNRSRPRLFATSGCATIDCVGDPFERNHCCNDLRLCLYRRWRAGTLDLTAILLRCHYMLLALLSFGAYSAF